jgi:calcineurin B family protein 1
MGARSSNLHEDEVRMLQKQTGFSSSQISRLYGRFKTLDKDNDGHLMKEDFQRVPELATNPLGPRIINLFFTVGGEGDAETVNGQTVNFRQFVRTLARFQPVKRRHDNPLNSREEKLKFAFHMYDIDGDELISKTELFSIVGMMVGSNISNEQLGSIADRTICEADEDQDGKISFSEFVKVMEKVDVEQKLSIKFR